MKKRIVKDYIVEACFELLKKNEVNKITITDIIQKAGICRASFYRNFYSIEDIVRHYLMDLGERANTDVPLTKVNVYEHTYHSFKLILEEKEKLLLLNKRGLIYLYDDVTYELTKKQLKVLESEKNKYSSYAVAGASAFVLRAWINNNFEDPIEEVMKSLAIY